MKMSNKLALKEAFKKFFTGKRAVYSIIGIILLFIVGGILFFINLENEKREQKIIQLEKKKEEQILQEKKVAATNRINFFLNAPVGARGGMNVSNYWEGSYRIPDTINKKMTVFYIKDGEAEALYVRYDDKKTFALEPGEIKLETGSPDYIYAYYIYPESAYSGSDKKTFTSMQNDFQDALKTFAIF
jgi:hypothetical protein